MASKSFLRSTGMRSPGGRGLMTPMSSKSILRRPAPLPLSPTAPIQFMANFSVLLSPTTNKLSPHVHFAGSPSLVATFSAFSPVTYDRAPMTVSPSSEDHSTWGVEITSPPIASFKLGHPPKRAANNANMLAIPSPFEDPRSPKPYKVAKSAQKEQVTTLVVHNKNSLGPPAPFEDPRSPKPYREHGARLEDLVLHVPRGSVGVGDLGNALATFPRSPYPSAPIGSAQEDTSVMNLGSPRGRIQSRTPWKLAQNRTRSLDVKNQRRVPASAALLNSTSNVLSPVKESPRAKPAPLDLESGSPETSLNNAFWRAVTLEGTPASAMGSALQSPQPIMFGNQDGTLWSPRPRKKEHRGLGDMMSMLSPAQKKVFRKDVVASPSPNDPFAAFPSFTAALMNMDRVIPYPPRARVGGQ